MTPLILAGAAGAVSFATEYLANKIFNPKGGGSSQAGSGKKSESDFDQLLEAQTALNAQKAQAERQALLAKPLPPKAQDAALEVIHARQENIAERLGQATEAGQLDTRQGDTVRALLTTAQSGLDTAMADGTLTLGEFRQVNASLGVASRQLAAYRAGGNAAYQSQQGSQSVSMNI